MTGGSDGRVRAHLSVRWSRVRRHSRGEGGYTLSEMIVVLTILGIVLAALSQLFVASRNTELDMTNRVAAQQDGRLALDKLRREIHCASAVSGSPPAPAITITLPSYCPTNGTGAAASFTWCTKDKTGTTPPAANAAPYTLWRYSGAACSGSGRKWVDNLTTGQVFTIYTAPAAGNLGTLSVDLPVDVTPSDTRQRYELKDDIVLRNTVRP
jgi:prepilin-type N-terminal cleavage/methylation domain-containing protein